MFDALGADASGCAGKSGSPQHIVARPTKSRDRYHKSDPGMAMARNELAHHGFALSGRDLSLPLPESDGPRRTAHFGTIAR